MKKTKLFIIGMMAVAFLISGCADSSNSENTDSGVDEGLIIGDEYETDGEIEGNTDGNGIIDIGTGGVTDIETLIENLVQDEYPQLEITAAVLERMAILPGSTVRLSIAITNNGDETINFIKGSGSFKIPDALYVMSEQIQTIPSADRLGIATMDFVVETLEPGDNLTFDYYLRMIQPNIEFDQMTRDLFMEEEVYVADLSWEDLQSKFPDLVPLESGTYEVQVFFLYSIAEPQEGDSDELFFNFSDATGYNMTTVQIPVN